MNSKLLEEGIAFFEEFLNPNRLSLINKSIENRTRYICLALENIYQSQNASAVLRSCDCFGIQDVHVIENSNNYTLNPKVVMGASKWLNLYRYNKVSNNTRSCIEKLRELNYRIIATTPHTDLALDELDLTKGKCAFFFGTELKGLSSEVLDCCDEKIKIPMYGFTESFNLSVSAALISNHVVHKLRKSELNWQLEEHEKLELKLNWLIKSTKHGEALWNKFLKEKEKK